MPSLTLTPEQQNLLDELNEFVRDYRSKSEAGDYSGAGALLTPMGSKANQLHEALSAAGHPPKHTSVMLENRGVSPDNAEFYEHIHPVEDLIAFVHDPSANADPIDHTMNATFQFRVYSLRWGHHDTYQVTRTPSGWRVDHLAINGDCDKTGHPVLFANLRQDTIAYPARLGSWFEFLWDRARDEGLTHDQVQHALNQLAEWVSVTEKASPGDGALYGYARTDGSPL